VKKLYLTLCQKKYKMKFYLIQLILLYTISVNAQNTSNLETIPLGNVWSGHSVGFDLLTTDKNQYVAYYDSAQNMVVAQRPLDSKEWKRTVLPTKVGWDSHNYIDLVVDKAGYIHVSGNMHVVPLIYFRSEKPEDISSFEKLPMTGKNENRVTYPVFFKDKDGELYFQYRNGGSGNGITYWNRYDAQTKTWTGLFDTPVFDGEEEANAYMTNPKLGPDGYFYIVWMWRLTPVANTNHNLSCIRSKDLVHWETLRGEALSLPIRWRNTQPVVDPVAPWNGLINMSFQINWDEQKTPYITYHKFDSRGVSQVFASRWEKGGEGVGAWKTYQLSQWPDFTWDLNRSGSLRNSVSISGLSPDGKGNLTARYAHEKYGNGTWLLDRNTLKIKKSLPADAADSTPGLPPFTPREGMIVHSRGDNTGQYVMRWQSLPVNQDKRTGDETPTPAELVVYKIR
jgi:hypothetical protein